MEDGDGTANKILLSWYGGGDAGGALLNVPAPPASTARTPRSQRLLEGSSRSHDRVTFAVENGSRCGSRSCLMKGVFLVHSLTH